MGSINSSFPSAGTAYLFYRDIGGTEFWGEVVRLVSPDPQIGSRFGSCVGLSGDHALVGSSTLNSNTGSSFHFIRQLGGADQWGSAGSVTLDNPQPGDFIGGALAISGQFAALGAWGYNALNGLMILLQLSVDGSQLTTVATFVDPPNGAGADYFGQALFIDSQICLIGADGRSGTGMAYSVLLPAVPAPPHPPGPLLSSLQLLLVIGGVALLVGGGFITLIICRSKTRIPQDKDAQPDELLEFSPRSDMAFIDMHTSTNLKRPLSMASGSSLASGVSVTSESSTATTLST